MVYTSLANLSSSEIQYRNISSLTPLSIYQIFRLRISRYFSVSVNQMCNNLELILILTSAMWTNKSTRKIIVFLDYIWRQTVELELFDWVDPSCNCIIFHLFEISVRTCSWQCSCCVCWRRWRVKLVHSWTTCCLTSLHLFVGFIW